MAVPKSVDGDHIYQTHFLDNISVYEKLVFATTWYFNDVLDVDKLHDALTELLTKGDWKKLAGRFRRGQNRKLELHVPVVFTGDRPAVGFSHESLNVNIEDHALFEKLPRRTGGVSFHSSPEDVLPFVVKAGSPETMADLLRGDKPALSLHAISFDNATIITLTWCHALMDANGLGTLVRAWSDVLAGSEPPPLEGVHKDILYELAGTPEAAEEQSSLAQARLTGFKMVVFVVYFLWELVFGRRGEARVLYLPKGVTQQLHERVSEEAASSTGKAASDEKIVSEYDSLLALWAKSFAVTQPKPLPVSLVLPFDTRRRLPNVFKSDKAYVQNLVLNMWLVLRPELTTGSLGSIALKLRAALQEHTRPPQTLSLLRSLRGVWDSRGDPTGVYGHPTGRMFATTDWSRADLFRAADFAPAVVQKCGSNQGTPSGSPFWYQNMPLKLDPSMSGSTLVNLGRDHEGNSWQMGVLPPKAWDLLSRTLKEIEA